MAKTMTKFTYLGGQLIYSKTGRIVTADYSIRGTSVYNNITGRRVGIVGVKNITQAKLKVAIKNVQAIGITKDQINDGYKYMIQRYTKESLSEPITEGIISKSKTSVIMPNIEVDPFARKIFSGLNTNPYEAFPELEYDLSDYKAANFMRAMDSMVTDGMLTADEAKIYRASYMMSSEEERANMWERVHNTYEDEFGFTY